MPNCKDCVQRAGQIFCSQRPDVDERSSFIPNRSLQETQCQHLTEWHRNSSSVLDTDSSTTLRKTFYLPKTFFSSNVSANSETTEAGYQPVASSLFDHINGSHVSSLSATFPTPSSVIPQSSNHSTLVPSSPPTLTNTSQIFLDKNGRPDLDIQNTSLQLISPPEQHQTPIHLPRRIQQEGEFICGCGAAFINICITFPINKTMFRQQLHGISGIRAINQLRKDGPRFLYRGLLPPLLQKSSSLSIMFGMYHKCQDILQSSFPKMNVSMNHSLAAIMAGTIEAIFTPFERIQALMQTREYHNKFSNTLDAFYSLRSYGLREYYRGISAIVMRNGPSNVAFFLGREYLQRYMPGNSSYGQKVALDFLSGAILGALISTCFFPLNVVKIRMQCVLGGPFSNILSTFNAVVTERNGLSGLYKGVHLNYMRSFVSWGIINASYELLMKTFFMNSH